MGEGWRFGAGMRNKTHTSQGPVDLLTPEISNLHIPSGAREFRKKTKGGLFAHSVLRFARGVGGQQHVASSVLGGGSVGVRGKVERRGVVFAYPKLETHLLYVSVAHSPMRDDPLTLQFSARRVLHTSIRWHEEHAVQCIGRVRGVAV